MKTKSILVIVFAIAVMKISLGESRIFLRPNFWMKNSLDHKVVQPNPTRFFRVEPNFGPKIWVESGWVGPQVRKTGPIWSGWPQIGFKFGFNPIHSGFLEH